MPFCAASSTLKTCTVASTLRFGEGRRWLEVWFTLGWVARVNPAFWSQMLQRAVALQVLCPDERARPGKPCRGFSEPPEDRRSQHRAVLSRVDPEHGKQVRTGLRPCAAPKSTSCAVRLERPFQKASHVAPAARYLGPLAPVLQAQCCRPIGASAGLFRRSRQGTGAAESLVDFRVQAAPCG
jgi:hypothetical protein